MPNKPVFLKTEHDFSIFKKSRSMVSPNLKIRWHVPFNQNHPRFGFIVPKKAVPKASARNLIKRRLKSLILKYLPQIKPVDILFFPKLGIIKQGRPELEQEFVEILKQAKIYAINQKN